MVAADSDDAGGWVEKGEMTCPFGHFDQILRMNKSRRAPERKGEKSNGGGASFNRAAWRCRFVDVKTERVVGG